MAARNEKDDTRGETFTFNSVEGGVGFASLTMKTAFRFNDCLDADKLRSSLVQLLQNPDWRRYAGRFQYNDAGRLQLFTPYPFPDNYEAIGYRHLDCSELSIQSAASIGNMPETFAQSSVQLDWSRDALAEDCISGTGIKAYVENKTPPLFLHVTTFRDGTLVVLIWPHELFDGCGMTTLLRAWSLVLAGKDSQVPPVTYLDDAQFRQAIADDDNGVEAEAQVAKPTIPMYKYILTLLWLLWRTVTMPRHERRLVVLTADFVSGLRRRSAQAAGDKEHTEEEAARGTPSDGALLTAWLAKMLAASDTGYRTARLAGICNLRRSLRAVPGCEGERMQNLIGSYFIDMPASEVAQPLWQLAACVSRRTRESLSAGEMRAFARSRLPKDGVEPSEGSAYVPRGVAPTVALPMVYNNLTSLDVAGAVDFAPAVVARQGTAGGGERANGAGRPLYMLQYDATGRHNPLNIPKFDLLGKTAEGHYYIDTVVAPATFERMEKDFFSDSPI